MRHVLIGLVALVVAMTAAEALFVAEPHHPPGVFALFGVVGGVVLVVLVKLAGKAGLQQKEPPAPEPRHD